MRTVGVGVSTVKNPKKAGSDAARQALDQLGTRQCHSCLVFSTVGYSQQTILDAVKAETGPVPMVGCSGTGVIGKGIADESNHALIVVALADQRMRLVTAGYPDVGDLPLATRAIGSKFNDEPGGDAQFALLFPCGLQVVADELIDRLEKEIQRPIPFIGGSAGENWLRKRTYQYHDWKVYHGGISAALVCGDFKVVTDVTHGCVPIGTELEITSIEGNRLYEINHRPVMDVMADYVGQDVWSDFGKVAVHFCLGQPMEGCTAEEYDPLVIRFVPQSHPEDKSISLPVKMNRGDRIWMTRRDHRKMFESAQTSVRRLRERLAGQAPFLALHFDCAGRGRVVMSEQDKLSLIGSLQTGIDPEVPWAGFFTYGEFCPVGDRNVFHNYTAALCLLY